MATVFTLLMLATLGVGGLLMWDEIQALLGPHSIFGLAGALVVASLAGTAVRYFAQGRDPEGIRLACLAVAAALALLAVGQWPEVQEARFREATLVAEMRLEAAVGANADPLWLSELERDVAVWSARQRHERELAGAGNSYRYARGAFALLLSLAWFGASFAGGRLHGALTS